VNRPARLEAPTRLGKKVALMLASNLAHELGVYLGFHENLLGAINWCYTITG
jgi:hypothetical protein